MAQIKVICRNTTCKHYYMSKNGCDMDISLNADGKCESYENGFVYYIRLVWEALESKNYIDMIEIQMNPDIRIGLYYVTSSMVLGLLRWNLGLAALLC